SGENPAGGCTRFLRTPTPPKVRPWSFAKTNRGPPGGLFARNQNEKSCAGAIMVQRQILGPTRERKRIFGCYSVDGRRKARLGNFRPSFRGHRDLLPAGQESLYSAFGQLRFSKIADWRYHSGNSQRRCFQDRKGDPVFPRSSSTGRAKV